MNHPLSDVPVASSISLDLVDVDEDPKPQDDTFLNPFAELADNTITSVASDNHAAVTATSFDAQVLAEEGRHLLKHPFDNALEFGDSRKEDATTTYTFTSARPRTASEPIAQPLFEAATESRFSSSFPLHQHYQSPAVPPSRSLSRRRGGGSSTASSLRALSVASISSSSTTSSSIRGGGGGSPWTTTTSSGRDASSSANTSNIRGRIEEETGREGTGARASMDSGMAAVRRWIRSRSSFSSSTMPFGRNNIYTSGMGRHSWSIDRGTRRDVEDDGAFTTNSGATHSDAGVPPHRQMNRNTRGLATPTISMETRQQQHQPTVPSPQPFGSPRQRALSEPDATVRNFLYQRALTPHRGFRQLRYAGSTPTSNEYRQQHSQQQQSRSLWGPRRNDNTSSRARTTSTGGPGTLGSSQLSSSAVEELYSESREMDLTEGSIIEPTAQEDYLANALSNNSIDNNSVVDADPDPQRDARARWIVINRRFQVVITIVALIFSLLLFGILVCWVILTSAYVISIDKPCDVPLKAYYWLATLQIILDVFRSDIMRCIFRWDANSNQRIPCRVITYNAAYLVYAFWVLHLGIMSVFVNKDATCQSTAPELYNTSIFFVGFSIAAWTTIILGYLLPFCIVATLLTLNGYIPTSDSLGNGTAGPVFPTPMGAPPGCINELRRVKLEDLATESSKECCICMEQFCTSDMIVETQCEHRYHKHCLADWLRQARTCPVCRKDIVPTAAREGEERNEESEEEPEQVHTNQATGENAHNENRLSLGPATRTFGRNTDIHHEVVSLFQIIRQSEMRNRQTSSGSTELRNRSGSIEIRNRSMSQHEV